LVTHHDAGEKIAQRRRTGIVTPGFVSLVGDKAVPLYFRAKLKPMEGFAIHRRNGPPRLACFPRAALRKLARRDVFEIGFDFEHGFLLVLCI